MTKLAVNQPLVTKTPTLVVDPGLAIGTHRFQLVVVDSSGLKSAAVERSVQITKGGVVTGTGNTGTTGTGTTTTGTTGTVLSPTGGPVVIKKPVEPVVPITPKRSPKTSSPKAVATPKPRTPRKKRSQS